MEELPPPLDKLTDKWRKNVKVAGKTVQKAMDACHTCKRIYSMCAELLSECAAAAADAAAEAETDAATGEQQPFAVVRDELLVTRDEIKRLSRELFVKWMEAVAVQRKLGALMELLLDDGEGAAATAVEFDRLRVKLHKRIRRRMKRLVAKDLLAAVQTVNAMSQLVKAMGGKGIKKKKKNQNQNEEAST